MAVPIIARLADPAASVLAVLHLAVTRKSQQPRGVAGELSNFA